MQLMQFSEYVHSWTMDAPGYLARFGDDRPPPAPTMSDLDRMTTHPGASVACASSAQRKAAPAPLPDLTVASSPETLPTPSQPS